MTRHILFFILVVSVEAFAQPIGDKPSLVVYKKIDTTRLHMEILYPPAMKVNKNYSSVVFFFGGGWNNGSINQFREQAIHFSQKGMVCFLVDYRVKSRQGTTPIESLKDAKSSMRFIRKNASAFHIQKDSIVGAGGSSGGHLAAAAALIDGYNETGDDLSISAKPNALVLFNPVIDNGPAGYGFERIGEEYKNFSPLHNIRKGAPPTIIFSGTKDNLVPVETVQYYKAAMQRVGSRCDVVLYEGQVHGFFNNPEYLQKTLIGADKFLTSLKFLTEK